MRMSSNTFLQEASLDSSDCQRQFPATGLPPLPSPLPLMPLQNSWPFYYPPHHYLRHPWTTDLSAVAPALQGYLGPGLPTPLTSFPVPHMTPPCVLPAHPSLQFPSTFAGHMTACPLCAPLPWSDPVDDTVVEKTEPASDTEGAKDDSLDEEIDVVTVEDSKDGEIEENNANKENELNPNKKAEQMTMMTPHQSTQMKPGVALHHLNSIVAKYGGKGKLCPSLVTTINSVDKEGFISIMKEGLGIINPNFKRSAIPPSEVPGSFRCSRCQKDLKNAKLLKRHQENHLAVKRFLCLFCPKAFNDSYDLKRHTRTHTGSLPFSCPVYPCNKAFAQRVTLESHLEKIHGMKTPYKKNERRPCLSVCELCQTTYSSRQQLVDHKKTSHPNDLQTPLS